MSERNGYLYVGTGQKLHQRDPHYGHVAKVRVADGAVLWSYNTRNSYQPSYPVSNGKVVVFGTFYDHTITGISDETGELLWKAPTGYQNHAAARFAGNRVFVPSHNGVVYAIDWATGRVLWRTGLHGEAWTISWSTPCIWKDRVLVGCKDGFLYGLDQATGRIVRKIDCGGAVQSNPVVAGQLLFVSADEFPDRPRQDTGLEGKTMLVIDPGSGKVIERFTATRGFTRNPVVAGHQVFFTNGGTLYAYDASRRALDWKTERPLGVFPHPLVTKDQVILPMNPGPNDISFEHPTRCVVLDRATGRVLAESDTGGVAASGHPPHYAWTGGLLLLGNGRLTAYRVEAPRLQ